MIRPIYDVAVARRRQRRRCAPRSRRAKRGASVIVVESRAARTPRRQQPPHAQPPLRARRAHRRADRRVSRRTSSCRICCASPASETNEALARLVVSQIGGCPAWMARHGARFQSSLRGTLHLGRTNAFFLGGGKALMNSYYAPRPRAGHRRASTTPRSSGLDLRGRPFRGRDGAAATARATRARTRRGAGRRRLRVEPRVAARGLGRRGATTSSSAARRTTRARVLRLMLDAGAQPVGDARAVPRRRDRRPRAEVRRRHRHAARLRVARHRRQQRAASASTTRARTSGRSATRSGAASSRSSRIRSPTRSSTPKAIGQFMPSVFPPMAAPSIRELARAARVCRRTRSSATVAAFNAAVRPGTFDHAVLDDCRTEGLDRPRRRTGRSALDTPPFWGYPLRPGITFTLSRAEGRRARARADGERRAAPTNIYRRRRDHGRQHPAARATSPASA